MSLTSYRAAPPRGRAIGFESDGLPSGARRGAGRGLEFQGWSCAVLGCFPVRCFLSVLGRPGGDLLSHVLRRSTIGRSEEHTSELQSLMRISYAVFCLKKKIQIIYNPTSMI